jgi:HEAT repeat protein
VILLVATAHAGDDLADRLRSEDWTVLSGAVDEMRKLPPAEAVRLAPQLLQVEQPLARGELVQLLGRLGPAAAPAVADLVVAAFDEDLSVRTQAAAALASLGPAAWKALALLPDLDPEAARALRRGAGVPDRAPTDVWAAEEWRKLGRSLGETTAMAALEEAFRHAHTFVRHRAAAELVRRGDASLATLDRLAGDPGVRVRRRAASALAALCRVEGAVPLLAARLKDPDALVRTEALQGLGAAGAIEPLEEYAAAAGQETLIAAVDALERARTGASHGLLRRLLRSAEPSVRVMAASRISYLGTGARPLLPDMIDAAFDEYAPAGEVARRSLLVIGGTPDEVAPWLREVPGMNLTGALAASKAELPRRIAADATRDQLVAALRGEDPLAAGQAAVALGALEPRDAPTAELLAAALRHAGNYARAKAALALAGYGDCGVAALVRALEDADARVRWRAIDTLGSMGAAARAAVPALVDQLPAPLPWPAFDALARMGPAAEGALPALVAILRGEDDARANSAMPVIGAIGEQAKPALPLLIEALDDKERSHAATVALGAFGRDAEPAVPELRRLIRESSPERPDFAAFQALLRIGGEGHRAIAEMFLAHPRMARHARDHIRAAQVGSKELVETLIGLARSGDKSVAPYARESLGFVQPTADIGPLLLVEAMEVGQWGDEARARALADRATVEELVAALPGTSGYGGWAIVFALGLKGPAARDAAPSVARCLRQSAHQATRVAAARTLVSIRGEEAVPDLLAALRAKPATDVTAAIEKALAEAGNVGGLADALADPDPVVRASAVRALGRIEPPPRDAVRALVENLGSSERYVKGVETPLLAMKADALSPVAALLRVDDAKVRKRTIALLARMGPEAATHLASQLGDHDPLARIGALEALRQLGEAGRPEAMRMLREDPHPDVRAAALGMLLDKPADMEAAKLALDDPELCGLAVSRLVRGQVDRAAAMDFLVEALGHPTARPAALRALDKIAAKEAQPVLRGAVAGRTGEARAGAALGLAKTGEKHVDGLLSALRSEHAESRIDACRYLATVGPEAAPAAKDLLALLDTRDDRTCSLALAALGSIGPGAKELLPALREAAWGTQELGFHCAVAVARIEGDTGTLLAILEGDEHGEVVLEALGLSGPAGARELGQLVVLAREDLRQQLADQLAEAGDGAVPVAIDLLRHEDGDVRVKAAWVLGKMGSKGRDAVPALIRALGDPETPVRAQAAHALGSIRSEEALPALEELRTDEQLKDVAEEAIRRIRKAR